jgi:hypothetical protein
MGLMLAFLSASAGDVSGAWTLEMRWGPNGTASAVGLVVLKCWSNHLTSSATKSGQSVGLGAPAAT